MYLCNIGIFLTFDDTQNDDTFVLLLKEMSRLKLRPEKKDDNDLIV